MNALDTAHDLPGKLAQAQAELDRVASQPNRDYRSEVQVIESQREVDSIQQLIQAPAEYASAQIQCASAQAAVDAERAAFDALSARHDALSGEAQALKARAEEAADRRGDHLEAGDQVAADEVQREIEGLKVEAEEVAQRQGANSRKLSAAEERLVPANRRLQTAQSAVEMWGKQLHRLELLKGFDALRLAVHALPQEVRRDATEKVFYEVQAGRSDQKVQPLLQAQAASPRKPQRSRQGEVSA